MKTATFIHSRPVILFRSFVKQWVANLRPDQNGSRPAEPHFPADDEEFRPWRYIWYSFPVQLFILHVKKNQLLLLFWVVLFGIVLQQIGRMLGIPYLFLDPEYVNAVNFGSLLIMGIATGAFTMAFHITCYILDAHRFGFLGNEKHPFNKFCVNNSLLPLAFLGTYLACFIRFQLDNEHSNWPEVAGEAAALLLGYSLMVTVLFYYFTSTNQDIFKILAGSLIPNQRRRKKRINRVNVLRRVDQVRRNRIRIDYFLTSGLKWRKADNDLIDLSAALRVLKQNHLNAFVIQCFTFALILVLGSFMDYPAFQIPAGASILVLFTLAVMLAGALTYWLRGWVVSLLLLVLFTVNFLVQENVIRSEYAAFGVDYHGPKADYSVRQIQALSQDSIYRQDVDSTLAILQNWRAKFPEQQKPKMIFICASGGGLRSALWTMNSLQTADQALNGQLLPHTFLITGASGGLVGASYLRELYYRKMQDSSINLYSDTYLENIGKDHLNPIIFTWVVNDLFLRFQKFEYGGHRYLKDRGYAFEQQLSHNTSGWIDKPLWAYRQPERNAEIPMMIMSPTIVNDGRKLYISPQPVSYMTVSAPNGRQMTRPRVKGIEFRRFFAEQDADNLRFLSALRMSATFPYIAPNVTLPSTPTMEIMDAGLSDNFGVADAVRFLFVFRDWISQNTSGVILLNVRDTPRERQIERNQRPSIFQKIFTPIGSLYKNWDYLQDLQNENTVEFARGWFKGRIHQIDLQYAPSSQLPPSVEKTATERQDSVVFRRQERAALSWHLTHEEKESIKRTIYEDRNQREIERLQKLLGQ